MSSDGSLQSAMHSLYDLELSSHDWVDVVRDVSRVFVPSARLHIHFLDQGVESSFDDLLGRINDEAVTRLAGEDVVDRLDETQGWETTAELKKDMVAVDIESEGVRAVALVEHAADLTENELKSAELLLHHFEASFLLRLLLTRLLDSEIPRDGLTTLMRHLREEADYVRLSEDCSRVWRGLMDGSWSLVELNRNQSRWQFVVKENPKDYRDPRALSRRESQVLGRAGRGESNKVIAHELELEESTVGSYLQRALNKLQITNRIELVSLRAAITAYEEKKYLRETNLRESSVTVLDALNRLDRPETKTIVANLRALVKRLD